MQQQDSDTTRCSATSQDTPAPLVARFVFGECDACGAKNRALHFAVAYGIETYACAECHHNALSDDADDIQDEINRLRPRAETGEQWAHICALEAALCEAEAVQSPEESN